MNSDYFDEYEEFFDFSSQFEELEKEDKITRTRENDENAHYETIHVEKDAKDNNEEGEWEDEITNDNKKTQKNESHKGFRLYKFRELLL